MNIDIIIDKNFKHFKLAMNALVVMCIILPFLQIFFGEFKWSSFFSSISIAISLTVATLFFKRALNEQGYQVKMNSFVYLVAFIPFGTIGVIASSYFYDPVKTILNVFPIYMMLPLMIYMHGMFRCIYKSLESVCPKNSIIGAFDLSQKDYTIVMNFTDKVFYEVFGNMKVLIGDNKVVDTNLSVDTISNSHYVEEVSETTGVSKKELMPEHFTVFDMLKI